MKLNMNNENKKLNASLDGFSTREANNRLKTQGPNTIGEKKKKSALLLFLAQFRNWLMIALLAAAAISFFLGQHLDAGVIFGLVLLSSFLGFIQEYKAEKTLEKLTKYISNKARVKRDGEWVEVDSQSLVVGDVVKVRIGDIAPADIVLWEVNGLTTNESVLTGESAPVVKSTKKTSGNQPQGLKNMVFMGTTISAGIGKGVVAATGKDTFFGKTTSLITKQATETEFQKQTKNFSKFLFKIILAMTVFVFAANSMLNKGVLNSFLFAVALAVGIAPELLPAIMTITLSQGALKIAKKKVIVKRLMSVEDLGNIDTLCTDKTGTLTKGEFSLAGYQTIKGEKDRDLIIKALLCTSGELIGSKTLTTNPVDKALWESNEAKKVQDEIKSFSLLDENEFDFERRRVSALVEKNSQRTLIVKGSAESLFSICDLTPGEKEVVKNKTKEFEKHGYRVIAIGEKTLDKASSGVEDEKHLRFLGFLLFNDPIKPSAAKSLATLKELGVNIKVLSGDSALLTAQIASQVGFDIKNEKVVTGEELDKLSSLLFEKCVRKTNLFARITPEQKYKIVASLNKEGHVVGFLGDGINDAPALSAADVGIAVDSGAAVAKENADIILLRKDLQILAEGIMAGRKTFGNIMKYILNTISANCGNMFTVSISSLFLRFIPLLPSQILLNNFISDIPLFAVATDNVDEEFVKKPKRWNIKTIGHFMFYFGLISSFFDLLTILPMAFIWHVPMEVFRTAWFVESSLSEMLVTFAIRTKLPFYKSTPSRLLMGFSLLSGLLVVGLPSSGSGKTLFDFASLPSFLWLWVGLVVLGYFAVTEVVKNLFFKRFEW